MSAVAIACQNFAMPPFPSIQINVWDLIKAKAAGFKNPPHGAAMRGLDSAAKKTLGSAWETNAFTGYITYRVGGNGAVMVFLEKECGKTAEKQAKEREAAAEGQANNGGAIGSGSGGAGTGGGGSPIGGDAMEIAGVKCLSSTSENSNKSRI